MSTVPYWSRTAWNILPTSSSFETSARYASAMCLGHAIPYPHGFEMRRVGLNSHYVKWPVCGNCPRELFVPMQMAAGTAGKENQKKTCLRDSVIVNYITI